MNTQLRFRAPVGEPVDSHTLRRFLFRDAGWTQSSCEVIRWWEARRLGYNVVLGAVGLLTLVSIQVLGAIGPSAHGFTPPLIAIAVYGGLANLCYTFGWMLELAVLRPLFGRQSPVVGATLFRYGLAFATGVTVLPNVVAGIDLAVRVVNGFTAWW